MCLQLRDQETLREWLHGELKIPENKGSLADAKKMALKQYAKYLGPLDPDWEAEEQQQQLGPGDGSVPKASSISVRAKGTAAVGGAKNSPPACCKA